MQRRRSGSRSRQSSEAWFVTALLLLAFLGVALVNEPDGHTQIGTVATDVSREHGFGPAEAK